MSDPNQSPTQPLGYVPIDYAPQRPTSVTVLAIIGIVLAALVLVVCAPMSILPFFVPALSQGNPGMAALKSNTPLLAWTIGNGAFTIVLNIFLLVAAIGSLRLMKWARTAMISYAVIDILALIANTIVQVAFVFPITLAPENLPPGTPANALGMIKAISYGSTAFVVLLFMIHPVMILIFFRKQHVVDAFERRMTL